MRPRPPELIFSLEGPSFLPATDVSEWINATFIDEAAEIENLDHAQLQHAAIGVLWTSVANARQGAQSSGSPKRVHPAAWVAVRAG